MLTILEYIISNVVNLITIHIRFMSVTIRATTMDYGDLIVITVNFSHFN